jgi:hypothetical protein
MSWESRLVRIFRTDRPSSLRRQPHHRRARRARDQSVSRYGNEKRRCRGCLLLKWLDSARWRPALRCLPEHVLAASQAGNLPKSETDLLESEAACIFFRLRYFSVSAIFPSWGYAHWQCRPHCCGASIATAKPCATRDPALMFCLTALQLSRRIVKMFQEERGSRLKFSPQTEISVALS